MCVAVCIYVGMYSGDKTKKKRSAAIRQQQQPGCASGKPKQNRTSPRDICIKFVSRGRNEENKRWWWW